MRRRIGILCAAVAVVVACSKGELVGTYASDTRLTVSSRMQARPLVVPEITCPITMRITRHEETAISGTFERMACDHPARPTADAGGTFSGFALADGTATVTFDRPPLTTENQITNISLVQCPEEPRAAGPFVGRIDTTSMSLENAFVIQCAAQFPYRGGFDVVYRIEGRR